MERIHYEGQTVHWIGAKLGGSRSLDSRDKQVFSEDFRGFHAQIHVT